MDKPIWQLTGIGGEGSPWLVTISTNPFRVGRLNGCQLCLSDESVSRHHAEFYLDTRGLSVCDLGSTNGTFVNRQRIMPNKAHPLTTGDLIHFAGLEFRVLQADPEEDITTRRDPYVDTFKQMLETKAVLPLYQPIVKFSDGRTVTGYELLGRAHFTGLPEMPDLIFPIAKRLGEDEELSALFRDEGIKKVVQSGFRGMLFFNTLPKELYRPEFPDALLALRQSAPNVHLGLEVNENTVPDVLAIQKLRDFLDEQDIELSYDDFGAGQARLVEILKTPPDYLKFDKALISNIDRLPVQKNMVRELVKICRDAGITTVAEGIESAGEAEVCRKIGFDLAQGYYFGKPSPNPPGPSSSGHFKVRQATAVFQV
jgi:EAL domain-containing protein (putative c-di-GMP-specific phosphodiesterase class I)